MYLTDVAEGGNTAFPRLRAAVHPKKGDAAFWYNLLPGGKGDELTLHGGCPVLQGTAYIALMVVACGDYSIHMFRTCSGSIN